MTTKELIFCTEKISTVLLYIMIGVLATVIVTSTHDWLVTMTVAISFSCLFLFVSTMYFGRSITTKETGEMTHKRYHISGACLIMATCVLAIFHFINAYTTNDQTVSLVATGLLAIPGILLFCYNFFIILVGVLHQRSAM